MQSYFQTDPDEKEAFQTRQVISETCIFIYPAPTLFAKLSTPHAYSNTRFGFDTNSCHLVQFTSKGRMMCIIRKAKNSRERRCFKVPEFDSSERLLVCVWGGTFVLC